MAIHEISDMIDLVNGEKLEYARRRKNTRIESLQMSRKRIIKGFDHDGVPDTEEPVSYTQLEVYKRQAIMMPTALAVSITEPPPTATSESEPIALNFATPV